jgi:hypothetical protein
MRLEEGRHAESTGTILTQLLAVIPDHPAVGDDTPAAPELPGVDDTRAVYRTAAVG